MTWKEFQQAAPDLAALGKERFERSGVILLGTMRKDGYPRISPVEPLITGGKLYLGMIPDSRKALDLLRDPRCTVHNTIAKRSGKEGEFKLYGRAVDVRDLKERRRYRAALYKKIGWSPKEPDFHLFWIDIEGAAFNRLEGEEVVARRWKPGGKVEVVRRWKPE